MAPVVCMMWILLFAFAPAATPPFWRVIEPTMGRREGGDGREDFVGAEFCHRRIGHANDLAQSARSAARVAALLRGVDAEQRAVGFVGEQVEQAVGALADVADAVVEVAEDTFAVEFFPLVVEIDAL